METQEETKKTEQPIPLQPIRKWKREEEEILREWADKALCFRWMHDRAHHIYRVKYALFTIPVIILSTLTGTANFAQDRFPESWKNTAVMAVGGLNIIAGIISTISQFLKISELNEGHRVASIAWGKFSRNLRVELARHPRDRTPVMQLTKTAREEYDRLMETSPSIPEKVITAFNNQVVKNIVKKKRDIKLPEICGDLQETKVFHPESEDEKDPMSDMSRKINWEQLRLVEQMKNEFIQLNGRDPTEDELRDMFDQTELSATKNTLDLDPIPGLHRGSSITENIMNRPISHHDDDYV